MTAARGDRKPRFELMRVRNPPAEFVTECRCVTEPPRLGLGLSSGERATAKSEGSDGSILTFMRTAPWRDGNVGQFSLGGGHGVFHNRRGFPSNRSYGLEVIWSVTRVLGSATVLCQTQVPASAQMVELGDVRLLSSPEPSGQSAVFELINATDRTITQLGVSCILSTRPGERLPSKRFAFAMWLRDQASATRDFQSESEVRE
jgi:hypothetical protein